MASLPEFNAFLETISSKHFEKLVLVTFPPDTEKILQDWGANDQVLRSFAERLHRLGAKEPLTMVLEYWRRGKGKLPDVRSVWPLFCEVGVVVKDYRSEPG